MKWLERLDGAVVASSNPGLGQPTTGKLSLSTQQ